MEWKNLMKSDFGNIFTLLMPYRDIEEQIQAREDKIKKLFEEIKSMENEIHSLMIDSTGQTRMEKLLNIQKIKNLKSSIYMKHFESLTNFKQIQMLMLLDTMRRHCYLEESSEHIKSVLSRNIEFISDKLFTDEMKKLVHDERVGNARERIKDLFTKEYALRDFESMELLAMIEKMEKMETDEAFEEAKQKAKQIKNDSIEKSVKDTGFKTASEKPKTEEARKPEKEVTEEKPKEKPGLVNKLTDNKVEKQLKNLIGRK